MFKHKCFKNSLNGIPGMGALTMEQTKKQLRAVLLSSKGGVALDRLEIEYFNLVGKSLASQTRLHGFSTVSKFLAGAPDVCSLHWQRGSCVVRGVSSQGTKHVVGMVSKQQEKRQQGKGRGRHLGLLQTSVRSMKVGENVFQKEDFINNEKKQQDVGSANPWVEEVSESIGLVDDLKSESGNLGRKCDSNYNEISMEGKLALDCEVNNNAVSDEAQDAEGFGEMANRVKEIVLAEPKIYETSLRQKLRDTGSNMAEVDLTNLLFRMSEDGAVELTKAGFGGRGISVCPSLRTLREAKASEGPEQMIASAKCKTIPTQQLPGHLKEGSSISIVVKQVKSPSKFWFNLHEFTQIPVYYDAVEALMDSMQKFYAEEGDKWMVESVIECQPGTVLAAQYTEGKVKQGFHRVIVIQEAGLRRLKLFYIDDGTTAEQKLRHVRFLPAEFGQLPGQALQAQLWGVEQVGGGSRWPLAASQRFFKLVATRCGEAEVGSLSAQIMDGVTRRRNKVERNSNVFQIHTGLSLKLTRITLGPKGTDIAKLLVAEGLAMWEDEVKPGVKLDSSVAPSGATTSVAASASAFQFPPMPT